MKFVDKMFSGDPAPWKDWIMRTHTPLDEQSAATSFLWNIVHAELDTYRSITKVEVHNGVSATFWKDHWLPTGPIFLSHPALFSHTTRPNVAVAEVFQGGIDLRLRPRLTSAARSKLATLLSSLQDIRLDDSSDVRLMLLTGKRFNTKDAYAALKSPAEYEDQHSKFIWSSAVPNKVKVFAWLYFKDRLSSRSNLYRKHVLSDDILWEMLKYL